MYAISEAGFKEIAKAFAGSKPSFPSDKLVKELVVATGENADDLRDIFVREHNIAEARKKPMVPPSADDHRNGVQDADFPDLVDKDHWVDVPD